MVHDRSGIPLSGGSDHLGIPPRSKEASEAIEHILEQIACSLSSGYFIFNWNILSFAHDCWMQLAFDSRRLLALGTHADN